MIAVILAGGEGRRLFPYTTNFPKPLMPVGDKPILEQVIRKLRDSGFFDIFIATGHLEELIRVFFGDGSKFGVNITYTKEDTPLGTAGPLNLLREHLQETFMVINGDVLTDINLAGALRFHRENGNAATVCITRRTVHIDYGVVRVDDDSVICGWEEKPEIDYYVSMGIYLFEPITLQSLQRQGFVNIPDFVTRLKGDHQKVGAYLHEGYWLDIGRPDDYERACKDFAENGGIK